MKTDLMSERCKWTVVDFEKAQQLAEKKHLRIIFSSFKYHEPTRFVYSVTGVAFRGKERIRVEWNYAGQAFVAGERDSEFDLCLEKR